ncbi:MAG: low affinity iron permease family protein [Hyphomonadaceae bacterium]|nr:low affinity iron permease family protein [Hyphomonadaceae bacterium]
MRRVFEGLMRKLFTKFANGVAEYAGSPFAFIACVAFVLIWAVTGPLFGFSDTWQLAINTSTTIITFLMVFLIQNTQNRDNGALHAKLDELIRAMVDADNEFIGIEHLTDQELKLILQNVEENAHRIHEERKRRVEKPKAKRSPPKAGGGPTEKA